MIITQEEIEADRRLMEEVYQHIKATGGKGCGETSCSLCGTYYDLLRDAEGK